MGKDVILDRYARLYEIPYQLARLGHDVRGYCLDYHVAEDANAPVHWVHEAGGGALQWESVSVAGGRLPHLLGYPWQLLSQLRDFRPDVLIGASDIPHVALARWLARRLKVPYAVDLYDNFEGFGQARIPGFVPALRQATREASLVLTTSEPLRQLVLQDYGARGTVISMPSSVDLQVFRSGDKAAARQSLGLPATAQLFGTAGGLYRDKGVEPLYQAWELLAHQYPDLHLVLAGPYRPELPPPQGSRVHHLGNLSHAQVAELFSALDVGVISILDTPFGRYCFPQKAYEMLACGLRVVVTNIGEMQQLFAGTPKIMFEASDADALAAAVSEQLANPTATSTAIRDWRALIEQIEPALIQAAANR